MTNELPGAGGMSLDANALGSNNVPTTRPHDTVGTIREQLFGASRFDTATGVAVLDVEDRLLGLIKIEDLLAAPAEATASELMDRDPPAVSPGSDPEAAAWKAVQHGEGGMAIVDASGRFAGLIPPHALLGVLLAEHNEDLARLGGFLHDAQAAQTASAEPVLRRFWHRLPWLLVGLVASLAAAGVVGAFEGRLQQNITLAFFIPVIVYLADAVGTQTEALVIRGMSVGVHVTSMMRRELVTGVAIGAVVAALYVPLGLLLWNDAPVVISVAVAILVACSSATLIAMALPWLLSAIGKDPAFGSGPLATVAQDLISLFIYFWIAGVVVGP